MGLEKGSGVFYKVGPSMATDDPALGDNEKGSGVFSKVGPSMARKEKGSGVFSKVGRSMATDDPALVSNAPLCSEGIKGGRKRGRESFLR
jgi:hypothetical protein